MIPVDSTSTRIWSKLGSRGSFGKAMLDLGSQNANILVVSADLCRTSGLDNFRAAFPQRLINVGIAEQDMIGIAAGLSAAGYTVFCTSFSNFITLRSCEQVRHYLGLMKSNVKLIGFAAGFSMGMFGCTHYGIEDIAIMRAIPNMTILSPADSTETVKATVAAAEFNGPVYLRLTGGINSPIVYKEDYRFEIGKAILLKEGKDIIIIATGAMVYNSLQAAKLLEAQGVSAGVIDMHTLKPLDTGIINQACQGAKLMVTVEEHNVIGGLGGAVAEYQATLKNAPPQLTIGIPDEFGNAGDCSFMQDKYALTAPKIAQTIFDKLTAS